MKYKIVLSASGWAVYYGTALIGLTRHLAHAHAIAAEHWART